MFYFLVFYVFCNKLFMIIIDIGRRIVSLFLVYYEKDVEVNFVVEFVYCVVIVESNWYIIMKL